MVDVKHKTTGAVLLHSDDATLSGKKLTGAALDEANLQDQALSYVNFGNANLRRADLSGAVLIRSTLDGANLERANLDKCDLTAASLLGTNLYLAQIKAANLRYAHLTGANLQGANLQGADASMADLRANLRDAILVGTDLRGSNLSGANLQCANLSDADLTGANLSGANLRGAQTKGAKVDRSLTELTRPAGQTGPGGRRTAAGGSGQVGYSRVSATSPSRRVLCPNCEHPNRHPTDPAQRSFRCRICKSTISLDRSQVAPGSKYRASSASLTTSYSRPEIVKKSAGAWKLISLVASLALLGVGAWLWNAASRDTPLALPVATPADELPEVTTKPAPPVHPEYWRPPPNVNEPRNDP